MTTSPSATDAVPTDVSDATLPPIEGVGEVASSGGDGSVANARRDRAPLGKNSSYYGLLLTQFLGAFNDNVYQQTILLLLTAVPAAALGIAAGAADGNAPIVYDFQGVGQFLFALPFLLFSGFAGFITDRLGKQPVIVASKVAEIAIMLLGLGMLWLASGGVTLWVLIALCFVLMAMGTQSTFFGPGKYGILPEMLQPRELPFGNGLIVMTTFLAIIFGRILAGGMMKLGLDSLWLIGFVCVLLAIMGTLTSLMVRSTGIRNPSMRLDLDSVLLPRDIRKLFVEDVVLRQAMIVASVFWLAASMVPTALNGIGLRQMQVSELETSILTGCIAIGIMVGALVAGAFSKGWFRARLLRYSALGLVLTVIPMALPGWGGRPHLLGFALSIPVLILAGAFTAMFTVPLTTLIQARPPAGAKGQMVAAQNFCNFAGIVLAGLVYLVQSLVFAKLGIPESFHLVLVGVLVFGIFVFYRPDSMRIEEIELPTSILGDPYSIVSSLPAETGRSADAL